MKSLSDLRVSELEAESSLLAGYYAQDKILRGRDLSEIQIRRVLMNWIYQKLKMEENYSDVELHRKQYSNHKNVTF